MNVTRIKNGRCKKRHQAGAAYVELWVNNTKFLKGMRNAQRRVQDFGANLLKVGASVTAAGAAITGVITKALSHFASVGDELDKMSQRTGVAAGGTCRTWFRRRAIRH
jgi:hypothetical protein